MKKEKIALNIRGVCSFNSFVKGVCGVEGLVIHFTGQLNTVIKKGDVEIKNQCCITSTLLLFNHIILGQLLLILSDYLIDYLWTCVSNSWYFAVVVIHCINLYSIHRH